MIFYGSLPYGRRIHLGNWLSARQRGRANFVYTFCGHEMLAWEEGVRPPYDKAEDFCRVCFRKLAWEVFQRTMESGWQVLPDLFERAYPETIKPALKSVRRVS